MLNLITQEHISQIRAMLDIRVDELNNIKPPNIIEKFDQYINQKMKQLDDKNISQFSTKWLLDNVLSGFPDKDKLGIQSYIAAIFKMLNILGFNPDKNTNKSFRAGFHDSEHAAYASSCDYFITDDNKCRIKSLATYEYLDIPTKVIGSEELIEVLQRVKQ